MAEIRVRGVSEVLKSHYAECAKDRNMSVSAYISSLLEKNYHTNEIEQRENKFYQVMADFETILSRQTEVMENFHQDVQILIANILEDRGLNDGEGKGQFNP
ncbi:hypothetical protein [Listeria booriae]|uniref:Uncharacterized protein n=1 Tax=Listeria booriae TaxID=1552123 RepID=A0A842A2J8_9LIST|nr:hypothetical protein [Listeria booriae]MBC1567219.1 hypothetical protein [Listeria booriae]